MCHFFNYFFYSIFDIIYLLKNPLFLMLCGNKLLFVEQLTRCLLHNSGWFWGVWVFPSLIQLQQSGFCKTSVTKEILCFTAATSSVFLSFRPLFLNVIFFFSLLYFNLFDFLNLWVLFSEAEQFSKIKSNTGYDRSITNTVAATNENMFHLQLEFTTQFSVV